MPVAGPTVIGRYGIDATRLDTTAQHPLGMAADFSDGTKRRYVKAGAAIALGDALMIDHAEGVYDWQPTAATTDEIMGVAPVAVGDNVFFWAIIGGKATVKVAAAITAGLHLVPTATAGELDDTAASAANALSMAQGIGVTAIADDTPSAGLALVMLN